MVRVCFAPVLIASCFAVSAPAPDPKGDRVLELPPFLVLEDKRAARPWSYLATPGHEILARCSDEIALDFAEREVRLEDLFATILPLQFQFQTSVPKVTILASPEEVSANVRDLITGMGDERVKRRMTDARIRFLPNLALDDVDSVTLFAIIDERRADPATVVYTRLHVQFMLERCVPRPPPWFEAGLLQLFDDFEFRDRDVVVRPFGALSAADVERLRSDPEYRHKLAPLREVFVLGLNQEAPAALDLASNLSAEASLLIRWALDTNDAGRRAAFWKLVSAARGSTVTDELVQSCFGFGLAELHAQLSDYLPVAIKNRFRLAPEKATALPKLEMRPATPQQIARIVGDWDRLEAKYVAADHREYAPLYLEQAHRALDAGRRVAPNDPALGAIVGLLEADSRNDVMARPFLESAADAKVVRPRVYYELARLRYREAMEHPAEPDGRLSALQANSILSLLATAHQQQPPIGDLYVLAAEIWNRSHATLGPPNLAMLEQAIAQFPEDVRLLYLVALLETNHGSRSKADDYVERGLQVSRTEAIRTRFQQLKETLAAKKPQ